MGEAAEPYGRRGGDVPRYTQDELDARIQKERDDARYNSLTASFGELKGVVDRLPASFEQTAQRIFAEQTAQLRKEQGVRNWRAADTLIALGQFLLAIAVVAVALFK